MLETTSHGLAQHRVTGSEYDVAVVTNITHEHLDYHGSYEAYREAKAMLFRSLSTAYRKPGVPKVAILNADDSSYDYLLAIPAEARLVYGIRNTTALEAQPMGRLRPRRAGLGRGLENDGLQPTGGYGGRMVVPPGVAAHRAL